MPPASKRKRDTHDEGSDSEEMAFGKQTLPVADLPADFDGEPMDGLQYLFTVRRDARRLPDFTRVSNPYAAPEPAIPQIPYSSSSSRSPHPALPTDEWCALLERRFSHFRANLSQPTNYVGWTHDTSRGSMPDKRERDLWWAFLEGKPESEWNITKTSKKKQKRQGKNQLGMRGWADEPEQEEAAEVIIYESSLLNDEGEVEEVLRLDPTELLPTPSGTPAPSDPDTSLDDATNSDPPSFTPREPTTKLIKLIDEPTALHLLMYFTHWINNHLEKGQDIFPPRGSHARWIFALLSRIDDHVSADDMNLLRNLARACMALLKRRIERKLAPSTSASSDMLDSMSMEACWMIISIVVHVWKQKDLWMDAESMLRRFPATAV
ncbi:hypothetical protein H1R20_g5530, partial [Candolleomyces eurysporus]